MRKSLIIFFLIILLVTAVLEIFLPTYYEGRIEKSVKDNVQEYDYLEVDVDTDPAILLLMGRVEYGYIKTTGIRLDEIRIESIEALYHNLRFINTTEGLKAVEGQNTSFKAVLTEKDLNDFLRERYDQFQDLNINLSSSGVTLDLKEEIFGKLVKLTLTGNFQFADEETVRFTPQDLKVQDIEVPKLLLTRIIKAVEFELDLEQLPLPLNLKDIETEEDKLIIEGEETVQ